MEDRHGTARPPDVATGQEALESIRRTLHRASLPDDTGRRLRRHLPALTREITSRLAASTASLCDDGRSPLGEAVRLAAGHFIDLVESPEAVSDATSRAFQHLGSTEAGAGRDLEAMRATYHLATGVVWRSFREVLVSTDLDRRTGYALSDALFDYMDYLLAEATVGHTTRIGTVGPTARRRLAHALLTCDSDERVEGLAAEASWPLPEHVVVVIIEEPRTPQGVLDLAPRGALFHHRASQLTMILPTAHPFAIDADHPPECKRLAHSWPTPVRHTSDAWRWARTTLRLVNDGFIEDARVVSCADHKALLLMHADPALIAQIRRDALAPLADLHEHHRRQLELTLLSSLRTHASAPQLAAELGVHQQTVRNRLRLLRSLFGEGLDNPAARLELQLALEAVFGRVQPSSTAGHTGAGAAEQWRGPVRGV